VIHRVSANKPSFREIEFTCGLNVILAERTSDSGEKDTRNGLGKSTLIDIIDFCLGGSAKAGKKLIIPPLQDWVFSLEITLGGNRVVVSRAVEGHNRIVVEGPTDGWPFKPDFDSDLGHFYYSDSQWKGLLGNLLFEVPHGSAVRKHRPSFRSLISYFIRTKSGAYLNPFKYLPQQSGINSRINVSFLMELSWESNSIIQELEDVRLGLIALAAGKVPGNETVGELESKRVALRQRLEEFSSAIASFNVHPQYSDIQEEANRLTSRLHELANRNLATRRQLEKYRESLSAETASPVEDLRELYEECEAVFSEASRRTLEEAREFHSSVVANRRDFLSSEIDQLETVLFDNDQLIKELSEERARSLEVLVTHGALSEMTKLQERNTKISSDLAQVQAQIDELRNVTAKKRKNKIKRENALKLLERDHEDRRAKWEEAIRLFTDNSQHLYDVPGKLVIDVEENGYSFGVEIGRSGSEGIDKMKIFCFDLALLQLRLKKLSQIDFLIHDTLMYDAVDPRQRARALERAEDVTRAGNGQYICTINSDMVPFSDFSEEFEFQNFVRLTLNDASPAGSLLGVRFERS